MNIFAIGDVHGCYHTFKEMVEKHWNPENEFLVQVGDLINKGKRSGKVYLFAKQLQQEYPYQVFFLKGNHEQRFIELYQRAGRDKTIDQCKRDFIKRDINLKKAVDWMKALPLKWETPNVLITHAGISPYSKDPYGNNARRGVLHNRSTVKNVGKLQVHGHMIQSDGEPRFVEKSDAWCIDTGAWLGKNLTGIRISSEGEVIEVVKMPTHSKDQ